MFPRSEHKVSTYFLPHLVFFQRHFLGPLSCARGYPRSTGGKVCKLVEGSLESSSAPVTTPAGTLPWEAGNTLSLLGSVHMMRHFLHGHQQAAAQGKSNTCLACTRHRFTSWDDHIHTITQLRPENVPEYRGKDLAVLALRPSFQLSSRCRQIPVSSSPACLNS